MIELFRTNQFFATLLLLPYTFLVRIKSLISPVGYVVQDYDTPLSEYFFTRIISSPIWQSIFACLIIFLSANFINRIIIQNRMSKHLTLIPGLIFILITAGIPADLVLSPALISCFFILLSILNLNKTYKNRESAVHIFNSGFYLAIGALFYPANLFFWFFGFIGLLNLRSFKIPEFMIYCGGFVVPYILIFTIYYWNDQGQLIYDYFQMDRGILNVLAELNILSGIYIFSIAIVVLFIILRYNSFTMKSSIQVQKKVDIIYWFMLFTFLIMFFIEDVDTTHLAILSIPFAIFIGLSFEKMKNAMMSELIHVAMVVAILFGQFQIFF